MQPPLLPTFPPALPALPAVLRTPTSRRVRVVRAVPRAALAGFLAAALVGCASASARRIAVGPVVTVAAVDVGAAAASPPPLRAPASTAPTLVGPVPSPANMPAPRAVVATCEPWPWQTPHREVYVALVANAMPGVGGGARFGQVFMRTEQVTWSGEVEAVGHDLSSAFGGDEDGAHYAQGLIGVRASFSPRACLHPYVRAGFVTFKSTGTNDLLDVATTYHGAFLGTGLEIDLGRHWTTGPDVTLLFGVREGSEFDLGDNVVVPQVGWHLTYWF